MVLHHILPSSSLLPWWQELGLGLQLLLLSLSLDRLYRTWDKLGLWFVLSVTSWRDKKQRLRSCGAGLLELNLILFPLVVVLVLVSAALAAPLLPLFTLPVWFVGFPRPLRFWPGPVGVGQNTCLDTVYYQQVLPELLQVLRQAFARGSLGRL